MKDFQGFAAQANLLLDLNELIKSSGIITRLIGLWDIKEETPFQLQENTDVTVLRMPFLGEDSKEHKKEATERPRPEEEPLLSAEE